MTQLSTADRAQRTPAQELAWQRLWEWLLKPDDSATAGGDLAAERESRAGRQHDAAKENVPCCSP